MVEQLVAGFEIDFSESPLTLELLEEAIKYSKKAIYRKSLEGSTFIHPIKDSEIDKHGPYFYHLLPPTGEIKNWIICVTNYPGVPNG